MNFLSTIVRALLLLLPAPNFAYSYVDPGTGGFIYQILYVVFYGFIGVLIGLFSPLKKIIKRFLSKKRNDRNDESSS